ncbi:MAG: GspE/PulE family protein [Gemmataceae bacterium]
MSAVFTSLLHALARLTMLPSRCASPPLAIAMVLAATNGLDAAEFPRGPGFYYSLWRILAFFVAFLLWIQLSVWADSDLRDFKLNHSLWNPVFLAIGVVGVILCFALPFFWIAWLVWLGMIVGGAVGYVKVRNREVREADIIVIQDAIKAFLERTLRMQFAKEKKGRPSRVPVRFFARGTGSGAEIARAQESKGYQSAQEMVYDAVKRRVTDIHLEPTQEEMSVRFRIDGIMVNDNPFRRSTGDAVINIFKVLCNMDITEKRKPQDGSFSAQVEDRMVDFRVATAGSVSGEKMVMRILDKSAQLISLEQIGMPPNLREKVVETVRQPHGMFIVCGPTGAGKSTTLYACLNEIDRFQQNVITIENPVEYQLENITQIEVNPKAGKTFASELRSILRQDPDVIMIGEIRDKETAEIACQAAQTGHMVFTTLHANDTVTAIGRLIDLGVQPFNIASALSAVLGQRLVRMLCPQCRVKYKPDAETLKKLNLPPGMIKHLYRAHKPDDDEPDEEGEEPGVCEKCGGTGYFKRTGIFELLVLTEKLREMIRENPDLTAIRNAAVKAGTVFLFEDGLRQVLTGVSSVDELFRVSK